MSVDDATMLGYVQDAIAAIISGRPIQTYSAGGIRIERCSLAELQEMEGYYSRRVNQASRPRILLGDCSRRGS